jgi:hypothetical protein
MHSQESKPGGVDPRIMDTLAEWSDEEVEEGRGRKRERKRDAAFDRSQSHQSHIIHSNSTVNRLNDQTDSMSSLISSKRRNNNRRCPLEQYGMAIAATVAHAIGSNRAVQAQEYLVP